MLKAHKMISEWTRCAEFTEAHPVGSKVLYKDKEYTIKSEAYVLVDTAYVLLEKVDYSVPIDEIH